MALSFGEPPVVSRSTTTKVTSASGVPSSAMETCSKRVAWDAGKSGTARTVGRASDSPGDARRVAGEVAGRSPGSRGIVGGRSYRAEDSWRRRTDAHRLRHLHRPGYGLRRLRRHRPARRPARRAGAGRPRAPPPPPAP